MELSALYLLSELLSVRLLLKGDAHVNTREGAKALSAKREKKNVQHQGKEKKKSKSRENYKRKTERGRVCTIDSIKQRPILAKPPVTGNYSQVTCRKQKKKNTTLQCG